MGIYSPASLIMKGAMQVQYSRRGVFVNLLTFCSNFVIIDYPRSFGDLFSIMIVK